ncbi:uncharacterized protein AC631_00374 [Debaryomyces fabryi]|uniref:Uncharacterized protein n=1 Tax=Debaryomyces fabryi TaxID=58627 RepID=A0A0V1Q6S0_9ASCO|nr:uncharacterized protein AC631_00374 [Debaryomyces fabryi]KSA03919.1 hypothetical protein AC631_00374 [Debaryomyces fabryi]CUM48831.1 unnamed protein product [Debaryomyces fabryi]
MGLPDKPSTTGYFTPQHGYTDLKIKTHNYSGAPTPFVGKQMSPKEFFEDPRNREHQKEFVKKGGKKLFHMVKNRFSN